MQTATSDEGATVVTDRAEAEDWCADREDRALGCPECRRVHYDADAFVCCEAEQAIPLTFRRGAFRPALAAALSSL
ncbi:hypothetical protein [Catenulispora rubra]|uniref:hypothetical protein n=1 Tax=Catenulispora rubra TaxID=280293 RepID=UPI00189222B9|nr:hypothetical protein [Catenulispora rubra]